MIPQTIELDVIFLLIFLMGVLGLLVFGSRRRVGQLKKSSAEIHQEEKRVFDFLHGLGAAFSEGVPSGELNRLIVEGGTHTLKADGGALYLVDRTGEHLIPSFMTKGCPALVLLPDHLLESLNAEGTSQAVESYLRLQAIEKGSSQKSLVGQTGDWKEPLFLSAPLKQKGKNKESQIPTDTDGQITNDKRELPAAYVAQGLESVMLGSLHYRGKLLGVLALAKRRGSLPFSDTKKELFQAVLEQSAFALFNQAIYLQAGEKHAMDHDLQIAREIQKILLPSDSPVVPGFEISGLNLPARTLSGDYFDYLSVDDDHLGIVIADVSGKGVPASLIMAMCRSAMRSQAQGHLTPAAVLRAVNRQLYPDMKEDMFISMAYVVVNRHTGEALLARAGHDAPLIYRAETHQVERLNPKGMAVGIDSGEVFDRFCTDFPFRFGQGDLLLLYTDGLTEALDAGGNEFGMERLTGELLESAPDGAVKTLHRLAHAVQVFSEGKPQHDDITLIGLQKL
jgi:sigma-B regulation protein RsbU (phosphoserine phosphatase)